MENRSNGDRRMLTIFCFKWKATGERRIPSQDIVEYGAEHVNKLYWSIYRNTTVPFRLVCITDEFDQNIYQGVLQLPLWGEFRELGGCYPRLKMFDDSEEFAEYLTLSPKFNRFACIDLDAVIVGNIDHILKREEDFVYYRMPGHDGTGFRFNCGLYIMDYGARPEVYHKFRMNPKFYINLAKEVTPGSDQAWCNYILNLEDEYYVNRTDGIYDMRQHFIEPQSIDLPDDARIVMWPGPRDPSEPKWRKIFPWIDEHWRIGV